jgi:hypothetical protein
MWLSPCDRPLRPAPISCNRTEVPRRTGGDRDGSDRDSGGGGGDVAPPRGPVGVGDDSLMVYMDSAVGLALGKALQAFHAVGVPCAVLVASSAALAAGGLHSSLARLVSCVIVVVHRPPTNASARWVSLWDRREVWCGSGWGWGGMGPQDSDRVRVHAYETDGVVTVSALLLFSLAWRL